MVFRTSLVMVTQHLDKFLSTDIDDGNVSDFWYECGDLNVPEFEGCVSRNGNPTRVRRGRVVLRLPDWVCL
jgi:hypothetical protein